MIVGLHTLRSKQEALLGQKYNLIGFSFTGLELSKNFIEADNLQVAPANGVTKLVREIKLINPAAKIILGGYSATFWAKEILGIFPFIDFICPSEGELTTLSLAKAYLLEKTSAQKDWSK